MRSADPDQVRSIEYTENMDKFVYRNILRDVMLPVAEEEMQWIFQHDRDSKYTTKLVGKCLRDNNVSVLEWAEQLPDADPTENLWAYVDRQVRKKPIRFWINCTLLLRKHSAVFHVPFVRS